MVVRFDPEGDPSATVRGDALWLTRAVDNLLDNARIHGDPGSPVRVVVAKDAGQVLVSFVSAGQIVRHIEKRLFRRFATSKAHNGGSGLGLAIVRAIVEAHSGSAECVCAGPPEVEFRITLPTG